MSEIKESKSSELIAYEVSLKKEISELEKDISVRRDLIMAISFELKKRGF